MSKIYDCLSPLGWIFLVIASYVPVWVIFEPTVTEFLLLFGLDVVIVGKLNALTERKAFHVLFPDSKKYFLDTDPPNVESMSLTERIKLTQSLMAFPLRRAVFCFFWGILKVLPAIALVVYYWDHSPVSHWRQFTTVALICLVNLAYFYSGVFVHSHIFISQLLERLHQRFDFSEVFARVEVHYSRMEFLIQESISLFCLFALVLTLQGVISTSPAADTGLQIVLIGVMGMLLFAYTWYFGRNYIIRSLENLFHVMKKVDYRDKPKPLPLHSFPLISEFEQTFNRLVSRLSMTERELSSLISAETEKSRYRTLGEISALIAHDLSAPLHTVNFCVDALRVTPEKIHDPRYMHHLSENLRRAIELIESLRAKLKNPNHSPEVSSFPEAHRHVLKLLSVQYNEEDFSRIQVKVAPETNGLRLKVPPVDLVHILDNIYRNSVENMIAHAVEKPEIQISVKPSEVDASVEILFKDNGTGLSREQFLKITEEGSFAETSLSAKGLGLRLTRRLIERIRGSLDIVENQDTSNAEPFIRRSSNGTQFSLKLPVATSEESIL